MTSETPQLNEHNKQEFAPAHKGVFDASPTAIYTSEDNVVSLDVNLENENVWLSQAQMSLLFDKDRTVIGRHINNVFKEGELQKELVCAKIAHTEKLGRWEGRFHN